LKENAMAGFHPYDDIVSLSAAPNPALAQIWENALREAGIHCQVVGDFLEAGSGAISAAQPKIWIKRQDETQAQAVLARCQHSVGDETKLPTTMYLFGDENMPPPMQARAIAFDLDPESLARLHEALPGWNIEVLAGATDKSLGNEWNPGEVDLLVVKAQAEATGTLALCRFLGLSDVSSMDSQKAAPDILGPRGSLQTQAQRAQPPLLVLVRAGQETLVRSLLQAGAHSCLELPIDAKDVATMLLHARAGNQPGRHTQSLEAAQGEDRWRDEGGEG
jgi:hypothetical protein